MVISWGYLAKKKATYHQDIPMVISWGYPAPEYPLDIPMVIPWGYLAIETASTPEYPHGDILSLP